MPRVEAERQVRDAGGTVLGQLGVTGGDAGNVRTTPCGTGDTDLYQASGSWSVPLAATRNRATLGTVRDRWLREGYRDVSYRELPGPTDADLSGRMPTSEVAVAVKGGKAADTVLLVVTGPCAEEPDRGKKRKKSPTRLRKRALPVVNSPQA